MTLRPANEVRAEMEIAKTPRPPYEIKNLDQLIEVNKSRGFTLCSCHKDRFHIVRRYIEDQGYTVGPMSDGSVHTENHVLGYGEYLGCDEFGREHWERILKTQKRDLVLFKVMW